MTIEKLESIVTAFVTTHNRLPDYIMIHPNDYFKIAKQAEKFMSVRISGNLLFRSARLIGSFDIEVGLPIPVQV